MSKAVFRYKPNIPDILTGLAIAFFAGWASFYFYFVFDGFNTVQFLENTQTIAVILCLTGSFFLTAVFKDRFSLSGSFGLVAVGAMFLLSGAVFFFRLPLWSEIIICLLSSILLMSVLFPIFRRIGGFGQAVFAFTLALTMFILISFFGGEIIRFFHDSRLSRLILCAAILAAGLFCARTAENSASTRQEDYPVSPEIKRPWRAVMAAACLAAIALVAVQLMHIEELTLFSPQAVPFFRIALMFSVMFMGYFAIRGRLWNISYAVITTFCIGEAVFLITFSGEPTVVFYLTVMLFIASLAGFALEFFTFAFHVSGEHDRELFLIPAFLLPSGLFYFYVSTSGLGRSLALSADPRTLKLLTAAVFLLIPMLLKAFYPVQLHTLSLEADMLVGEGVPPPEPVTIPAPDAPAEDAPRMGTENDEEAARKQEDPYIPDANLIYKLTNAEKKVYELVLQGYSNNEIAGTLYISINTVKFHIKNILSKAGVKSKYNLVGSFRREDAGQPPRGLEE